MQPTSQDERYAPPQSHVEDVQSDDRRGQLAGRWTRLFAYVADGVIMTVASRLLANFSPLVDPAASSQGLWTLRFEDVALDLVVFLLLNGYLLVMRGQTIGKAIFRIRIVRPGGAPASAARVVGLRYCLDALMGVTTGTILLYALVDGLFIFRKSRRCLHDIIADTVVVRA
ncbi:MULTISPECIES: RDD family protein [unclassified Variovorax]|uniref:RDD family protein n=1 Tax=unclassified Variovorax TaxID=663243 RepID=UPI001BD5B432|nr:MULTISPECIES: RDD family protein [unclassified Variovorax]